MSGIRDNISCSRVLAAIAATLAAGDLQSAIIDGRGFDAHMLALQFANSDEGGTATVTVIAGNDPALADGVVAPQRDVLPQAVGIPDYVNNPAGTVNFPAGAAGTVKVGYVGSKRYFRFVVTANGTTQDLSGVVVSQYAHQEPVA